MKDYRSTHMVKYETVPGNHGIFNSIEVLEFLKGTKWGEVALTYVSSLRPSSIRVTTGDTKCDARVWRVTVYVDENDIIQEIIQEVQMDASSSIWSGSHLKTCLEYGIDSEQADWYRDHTITGFTDGFCGYHKSCADGLVPFPEVKEEKDERT